MLKTDIFDKKDQDYWDNLAARLGGEYYHCHASAMYAAMLANGQPLFVEARNEEGHCVGIAVGTLLSSRKWPFSRYCRVATFPATPVAGGNLEIEQLLLQEIECQLRSAGAYKIEFASYHSSNSRHLLPLLGYDTQMRYEYEFNLLNSEDELFNAFHPNKRRQLRNAEKRGLMTVREVDNIQAYELVEQIHNISMARRGIKRSLKSQNVALARRSLYESVRTRAFVTILDDKPACVELIGIFNNHAYGLRSGSTDEGNRFNAPTYQCWTLIKQLRQEGYKTYSLGGARHDEVGLRKYKQELGAVETIQPNGSKILCRHGALLERIRRGMRFDFL
jgi:hypothetical protein